MIGAVRTWLTSVAAVTLLLSVVQTLTPEGAMRKIAGFTGGLVLLAALLQPLLGTDLSRLRLDFPDYQREIEARAAELYRQAHEQGHVPATCSLGLCYELGRGVEEDKEKAAALYRQAAEQGYARAQCNLGFFYCHGIGVREDQKEAFRWFFQAAEQGYARARFLLGECYERGRGVEQSRERALELYRQAAEQGYQRAQEALKRLESEKPPKKGLLRFWKK